MPSKILDLAREVLTIEAEGLTTLIAKLDASFVQAVDLIYRAKGRVISQKCYVSRIPAPRRCAIAFGWSGRVPSSSG